MSRRVTCTSLLIALALAGCDEQAAEPRHNVSESTTPLDVEQSASVKPKPSRSKGEECEGSSYRPSDNVHAVYFYCDGFRLAAVPAHVAPGGDPVTAIVATYIAGPTKSQQAQGYLGSLPPRVKYQLRTRGREAVVDLDGDSFAVQMILGPGLPIAKPLERALRRTTPISTVLVLVDGATICSIDPECGGGP